jgi:hypothetical protein
MSLKRQINSVSNVNLSVKAVKRAKYNKEVVESLHTYKSSSSSSSSFKV